VAGPAKAFKVGYIIGTPMCFGDDVIDSLCGFCTPIAFAALTQVFVAGQYVKPEYVPLAAVAALVPGLPALMLLPAFITMLFTIT